MSNQISIAKALKIKSRLAGEIAAASLILQTRNSYLENAKTPKVDTVAAYEELNKLYNKLIEVKSKISVANAPIYEKMETMNQMKSLIKTLDSIQCVEKTDFVYPQGQAPIAQVWVAQIPDDKRNQYKAELQKKIEFLQDQIDEFNAVTRIEISF